MRFQYAYVKRNDYTSTNDENKEITTKYEYGYVLSFPLKQTTLSLELKKKKIPRHKPFFILAQAGKKIWMNFIDCVQRDSVLIIFFFPFLFWYFTSKRFATMVFVCFKKKRLRSNNRKREREREKKSKHLH